MLLHVFLKKHKLLKMNSLYQELVAIENSNEQSNS